MVRLASLLWEDVPSENLIHGGMSRIEVNNLERIPVEYFDELYISRDDDYDINVSCVKNRDYFDNTEPSGRREKEYIPGEEILPGEILLRPFGNDWSIKFSNCFYEGSVCTLERCEYKISCNHIDCKYWDKPARVISEWILNGRMGGLKFCVNSGFEYTLESAISGVHGNVTFPIRKIQKVEGIEGSVTHFKYKDTYFDIHSVGDDFGPKWSEKINIVYLEEYGRIPNDGERKKIREYFSFVAGTKLLYIGNSRYDENGNLLGFEMENPQTSGFNIGDICGNAALPPMKCESPQAYFEIVQKYLEPFVEMYEKLDFDVLLGSFWYSKSVACPYDIPILSGALEYLMRRWYECVELNPETLIMDKADFKKRVEPIKKVLKEQFKDTKYEERMQRTLCSMNRMSVNEKMKHFFEKIGMPLGDAEEEALGARNASAHGSFWVGERDYAKLHRSSVVYRCIISRVILILIGYDGKYIDYGSLGHPEVDIKFPSGSKV